MSEIETPAWMVCVDMLNRLKRELVTEAIDTLEREIEAGRVDIKGSLITLPDQPSEVEMKLFVIGKMIGGIDEIRHNYAKYASEIETKGEKATSAEIENFERSRKFIFAVEKISMLIHYSNMFDEWINDASMMVGTADGAKIIKETAKSKERKELVAFVLKNRTVVDEEILTREERTMLEGVV